MEADKRDNNDLLIEKKSLTNQAAESERLA